MVYQFSGSGRYQTPGLASVSLLFLAFAVPDTTRLTLRWNGQNHTLLFLDAPSAPNEFGTGDGSAAYVDALLLELQGYFPIREDFTLTRNAPDQLPGIILTARKPGKAYDISVVNLPVGTPFGFGNTVFGADAILRTQYSVYAELWLQKVGTTGDNLDTDYERVFSPMIETDALGNAQFDVGNTLHSYLTPDWPSWNLTDWHLAEYSQRKYYVAYGEAYGAPIQVGRVVRDAVKRAYLGGSDYVSRAGGALPFLGTRTDIEQQDTALRYGPLTRYVRPDEPQFLTFLNSRQTQPVLLKVIRIPDDQLADAFVDIFPDVVLGTGQKITFSVGMQALHILDNERPDHRFVEYTVQLVSLDELPLSVAYRFIINYDYQPYTRYFAYLNSLGAVDTLTTFGKGSRELNRFFEQAERYLPALYEVVDGQFVDYDLSLQQSVEVATGYRSETELRGWNDFYRSPNRFHLVAGKALPLSITSKSIKQAKDGDTLFAHLFQFVYLFRDDFYSASLYEPGDSLPPAHFTPGGSVTIEIPQLVQARDDTVPDVVRTLTAPIINSFKQAVAWGNHALAGYLNQATGSLLFRRKDQKISWLNDLTDRPATRDQAGLTDVPTTTEVRRSIHDIAFKLSDIQPRLTSWLTDDEPPR